MTEKEHTLRPHIYIVEDDEANREKYIQMVDKSKYNLMVFSDNAMISGSIAQQKNTFLLSELVLGHYRKLNAVVILFAKDKKRIPKPIRQSSLLLGPIPKTSPGTVMT